MSDQLWFVTWIMVALGSGRLSLRAGSYPFVQADNSAATASAIALRLSIIFPSPSL